MAVHRPKAMPRGWSMALVVVEEEGVAVVFIVFVGPSASMVRLPTNTMTMPTAPPTIAAIVLHFNASPNKTRLQKLENNGELANNTNVVAAAVLVME